MAFYPNQQFYPYQQPQMQVPQMQVPQPQMQNNSIIWVQGEAGAKSYLVAPNTTVQLWDSEAETIYLKSADASGMPSIKVLDYKVRGNQLPHNTVGAETDFATRADINQLQKELEALKGKLETISERGEVNE